MPGIVIEQAPDSPQHYDHVASVHAPILRCGATERAWLILRGSPGSTFGAPAHFLAKPLFLPGEPVGYKNACKEHNHEFQI